MANLRVTAGTVLLACVACSRTAPEPPREPQGQGAADDTHDATREAREPECGPDESAPPALATLGLERCHRRVEVRVANEHRDRGLQLLGWVEHMLEYNEAAFGTAPDVSLVMLDAAQWTQASPVPVPYGLPFITDEQPPVAYFPATDDHALAGLIESHRAAMKPVSVERIERAAGSFEHGAAMFAFVGGFHEIGHAQARALGIETRVQWFNELVATSFAYGYMLEEEPELAAVWDGVLQGMHEAVQPSHRTLAEFDEIYTGLPIDTFLWFHAAFQQRARACVDTQGPAFLRAVKANLEAEGPLTSEDAVDRLNPICPGFTEWAAGFAAG